MRGIVPRFVPNPHVRMRTRLELRERVLEEAAPASRGPAAARARGGAGLVGVPKPAQQLATGRMQVAVVVEVERVDELEAALRAFGVQRTRARRRART